MGKNRKIMIAVSALFVISLMASPALAVRRYRPTLIGPTRWVSVYEPETFVETTYPTMAAAEPEKSDVANAIDGTAEFIGDAAETIGVAFGETVVATGEVVGGAAAGTAEMSAGIIGGVAEIIGGALDFIFGGWGCPET